MHTDFRPTPMASLYTLETTAKDVKQIEASRSQIPPQTPINLAFLGNENHAQRIDAAGIIRKCGFEPVPIISVRRLESRQDFDHLLHGLNESAKPSKLILVGGDPSKPAGPFRDSLDLLKSGIVEQHPIHHIGIVAYPEEHPKIETNTLWQSLKWKLAFLQAAGFSVEITTQFGFDACAIVRWIERLRKDEIDTPFASACRDQPPSANCSDTLGNLECLLPLRSWSDMAFLSPIGSSSSLLSAFGTALLRECKTGTWAQSSTISTRSVAFVRG